MNTDAQPPVGLSNHQLIALSLLNAAFYMAGVCGLMDLIQKHMDDPEAVEEVVLAVCEMCEENQHAPTHAPSRAMMN